jgi:dTDP-L-rhamnose 4-epimerase
VAEEISKAYGSKAKPTVNLKFRKGDVRHCYADISKIRRLLGYEPKYSFEEGMKELIAWSRNAESVDNYDKAYKELKEKKLV